jgi:hypothetical protein
MGGRRGCISHWEALEERIRQQLGDREYELLIRRLRAALRAMETIHATAPELLNSTTKRSIALPDDVQAGEATLAALADLAMIFAKGSEDSTPDPVAAHAFPLLRLVSRQPAKAGDHDATEQKPRSVAGRRTAFTPQFVAVPARATSALGRGAHGVADSRDGRRRHR